MKKTAAQLKEDAKTARLRALRLENEKIAPKPKRSGYPDQLYELYTEMRFGKHKGKLIEQIMVDDIGYITWCLENIANFHLSERAEDIYLELHDPRRK